jgi:hypothetical protein
MARTNSINFDDLIAKWEPQLRVAFLKAMQRVADRMNLTHIADLVRQGKVNEAVEAVGIDPLDFRDLVDRVQGSYNNSGQESEKEIPRRYDLITHTTIGFAFDVRNLNAEEWVKTKSTTLVQGIIDDQKVLIRNTLTEGLIEGKNPVQTAYELAGRINKVTGKREGGIIGLTSQQALWGQNLAKELDRAHTFRGETENFPAFSRALRDKRFDAAIKKAINTGKPIPADVKARILMSYNNRALKYRADVIARNETMRSIGAAHTEAYRQAIAAGHLIPSDIRRYWVTAGDERVRHTHRLIPGMNPEGRGWDEAFETPTGPSMHAPHDIDIMCRCREKISTNYFAKVNRGIYA